MPTTPHRTKTLRSLTGMIAHVSRLRDRIETEVVEAKLSPRLEAIFDRAERALAIEARKFRALKTNTAGEIVRSSQNIATGLEVVERLGGDIRKWIVRPGNKWADRMLPVAEQAGYDLAAANLEVRFLSQEFIDGVFDHVPRGVPTALRVGKDRVVEVMGTVGRDVQTWFRNEMLDAVTEGIPLQGPGDSLANRLVQSGRIRPTVITARNGRQIRRSVVTRANAIARVESARVMGDVHETFARDALGDAAVYQNSNPRDSRTTTICRDASKQKPATLKWWQASRFGSAPRFEPFHLCRRGLIGGRREWFEDDDIETRPAKD